MKVLLIDACPRAREVSRSYRLGEAFLQEYLRLHPQAEVNSVRLDALGLRPLTGEDERARAALIDAGRLDDPRFALARDFAQANLIAVCAPYWDFMFPAALKTYIEHICVRELTFVYRDDRPVGLCRAAHLAYFTTSGSPLAGDNWGGEYLKAVTGKLLGVKAFHQVSAEGLDLAGADPEALLSDAIGRARALAAALC